jgi:hypothetical protein
MGTAVDTNLAYVAGLIDGEGCIHLDCPRGVTYRARVSVGMTEPALPLLQGLRAEWGGTLYQLRKPTDRWAGAWTWHLTGSPATALLTAIRPFLRLKSTQAESALRVEAIRDALPNRANGQKLWSEEARSACLEIKAEMHELNRKGPRVPVPSVGAA